MNHEIYSLLFSEEEKSDQFIDEHQEEEDVQPSKSLMTSYRDHKGQDKGTPHPLLSELDDQLIGAKYFSELDVRWGYDKEHIKDEDKWEMTKTNQQLLEPTVITSSLYYSPTTSQTETDELFPDQRQKNEQQNIVNKDYVIQTKEQDTKYTRCVQRRSRDNDLFTEPEGSTSWATRAEYKGLFNPENQLQTNLMKLYGIDIWPTPAMTTEVKSFLRLGNVDKGFIQDNWTLTEPLKNLFEMNETFQEKKNGQDDHDTIILTEDQFLDLLDHGFDGKRTFENNDEQFDPIKTLSVHEPKTLHNHFSKVTAATSVNDVIAANVTNMDLRKWITMAQDMNVIVDNTINMLSEKKPNTWKDILEDWLIGILRSPNRNTEVTNCSILW